MPVGRAVLLVTVPVATSTSIADSKLNFKLRRACKSLSSLRLRSLRRWQPPLPAGGAI